MEDTCYPTMYRNVKIEIWRVSPYRMDFHARVTIPDPAHRYCYEYQIQYSKSGFFVRHHDYGVCHNAELTTRNIAKIHSLCHKYKKNIFRNKNGITIQTDL